jgi:uncharacterized protein (TIGR02145 family)
MKTLAIVFVMLLASLPSKAQDYFISFAASGDTTVVSTINADNLTSGESLTLSGGDMLHLVVPEGTGSPGLGRGTIDLYPNPMAEQAVLWFSAPGKGNAVISIADVAGRTVCLTEISLSAGTHSFRLSGIGQGLYLANVRGANYSWSAKLLSQGLQPGDAVITYIPTEGSIGAAKSTSAIVDMPYTDGDRLLFNGQSGPYSNIVTDVPAGDKTITFVFAACTDSDGNHYATVQIGAEKSVVQTWMAENLKTTRFKDGSEIDLVTDYNDWPNLETPAYCWYDNDEALYKETYGALYNWFAVMIYPLCPTGWHVPTDEEWTLLTDFCGGESIAGSKLKETGISHWISMNEDATNETGFTALPGGYRGNYGAFISNRYEGNWWSSTPFDLYSAMYRNMYYAYGAVTRYSYYKTHGLSVRCLKD